MIRAIKEIITSKILVIHFTSVFLISFFICGFLYMLGIPLIYWFSFGEGAESERIGSKPINIFIGEWGAVIFVVIALIIVLWRNYKQRDLSLAKSYLIAAPILTILYLFRVQIGDFFFGL